VRSSGSGCEANWKSILGDRELVIDAGSLIKADLSGIDLLYRMRKTGARVEPALSDDFRELLLRGECATRERRS